MPNLSRKQKTLLGSTSTSLLLLAAILLFYIAAPPVSPARAYSVRVDNNVDADSNIDATDNIGSDGATSYTDAQSLDGTDQTIQEGNGAAYVEGVNISDTFDSYATDIDSYPDVGTDASWANAQATSADSSYMTMQEANLGGAGGSEWLSVDSLDPTWNDWDHNDGASPYLDVQDQPTNVAHELTTGGVKIGWFDFGATSLTGSGITVNVSIYCANADGASDDGFDVYWDVSGGGGALLGWYQPDTTYAYITVAVGGTYTATEVNAFRIYLDTHKSGSGDDVYADHGRIGTSQAGGDDYELDLEYQFTTVDNDNTYEYYCVYVQTATQDNDQLKAWEWNSGGNAWVSLGTLTSNAWNNFTATQIDSATEYIKFNDTDQSDENTQSTWNMDCIFIRTSINEVLDYELQWEHQAQSMDDDKDSYQLCIYGFSSDAESIEIQMWNHTETTWDTALGTTVDTTEQWYNQSIGSGYIDGSSQITWRYHGTSESGDTAQTTLSLDWSGISAWNFTIYDFVDHNSLEFSPDTDYHALIDSPLNFTVESGVTYHVQIKGVDETGTPITDGYVYFNTVDNSGTSTLLTTSYQTLYSSQTAGTDTLYVYLWINTGWTPGDSVIPNGLLEYNVTLSIITA